MFLVRRLSTWMTRRISSSRPITGSSLPVAGSIGQVAAVLLERLVGRLGVLARHALVASNAGERLQDPAASIPCRAAAACAAVAGSSMMASSRCSVETYSSRIRSASGWASERMRRASVGQGQLGAALTLGSFASSSRTAVGQGRRILPDALEDRGDDAFRLVHQREEQVQRGQLGVALALGQLLRSVDRLGGLCVKRSVLTGIRSALARRCSNGVGIACSNPASPFAEYRFPASGHSAKRLIAERIVASSRK